MRTTAVCSSVSAVISIYRLSTPSASETVQKLASSNVPSHLRSSSVADSNTSSSRSGWPTIAPSVAAAVSPFRPPEFGMTTDFTFLIIFALHLA